MPSIILASASPRRKQLLTWSEIEFEVFTNHKSESYSNSIDTKDVPAYLSLQKALAVQEVKKDKIILAADTIVLMQNKILGKPINQDDAYQMLSLLSNNTHQVITGVSILHHEKQVTFSELTEVEFAKLSDEQIMHYIEKYKPYDKAGSYAIQEWIGLIAIKSIKGCFYNVMGLPMQRVYHTLQTQFY
ncbi:MAG: Maf family nucleotide pyrophosphatase [Chitinophagaceae bacterium]